MQDAMRNEITKPCSDSTVQRVVPAWDASKMPLYPQSNSGNMMGGETRRGRVIRLISLGLSADFRVAVHSSYEVQKRTGSNLEEVCRPGYEFW